jgi:phage host-nuclease inhibitor protein Gam
MARKRLVEPVLKDYEQVNGVLADIAELERGIQLERDCCNEAIDKIKSDSAAKLKPLADQVKILGAQLKEFCDYHRQDFAHVKTKKLTHGSIGFRLSTSVSIPDPAFTCTALRVMQLDHCIRTKVEPDKDAMKQLTLEQLAQCGAVLKSSDTFGYEIAVINPAATAEV